MRLKPNLELRVVQIALLLSGIHFSAGAQLYVGELLLAGFGIRTLYNKSTLVGTRIEKNLRFLFKIWFLVNLLSSIYNHKSVKDSALAIFTVLFSYLIWVSIAKIISSNPNSMLSLLTYYAIGGIAGVLLQPSLYSVAYPWKFGLGGYIALLGLSLIGKVQKPVITLVVGVSLVWFSIIGSARSLAVLILLGVLSALLVKPHRQIPNSFDKRAKKSKLLSKSVLIGSLAYLLYSFLASRGILGSLEFSRVQILRQSMLGPFAGRSEFFYSVPAFMQKPLLGFGYNPEVSSKFLLERSTALARFGIKYGDVYGTERLPIHSYLMQNFIIGGVLAGLFWIYVFILMVKFLQKIDFIDVRVVPVLSYMVFSLMWAILFSPYGAEARVMGMLTLAAAVHYLNGNIRHQEHLHEQV